jgi:hypothetical protein
MVVLAACGGEKSSADAVEKKLTLRGLADKGSGIEVSVSVPSDWTEEDRKPIEAPGWKPPGGSFIDHVALVSFPCDRGVDECLDRVQGHQFDKDELAKAKIEQLGPGKRFVTLDGTMKGERRIHARLFWHHAPSKAVVMCVTFLGAKGAEHAVAARKICDSLKLP